MYALRNNIFRTLNCVKIGIIQSFDGTKKTAQVQLVFKIIIPADPSNAVQSYKVLADCPVVTLQGGGGAIEFPIAAGDHCLVLFSDKNIDAWYQQGVESAPYTDRNHDISDAICLVGLNALTSTLSNYVSNTARFFYAGAEIDLKSGQLVLKAQANGAEIDLDATLIKLKNATTTLGTLIANFITALEGLQVNGPLPLTAASVAALEAQKVLFATLLE